MKREHLTTEYAKTVCRIGQGHAYCRYLTMSARGWDCQKHGEFREHLDQRVADNKIVARGDNCEGVSHE